MSRPTLSSLETALCNTISAREEELRATLAQWVAVPTGPQHAEQWLSRMSVMRDILISRLTAMGASVQTMPGTPRPAWLSRDSGGVQESAVVPPLAVARRWLDRPGVLLCGHIDTVHAPDAKRRDGSAFDSLAVDGDRAIGPGCADMKGGLLVALTALEAVMHADVPLAWGFAIVSDEETGTLCGDAALREEASRGYRAGLIFEPALPNGGLVIERPGSAQFVIEARGRAAHVGRDFGSGISAVDALARAIVRAGELADGEQGRIVCVGPLEGNDATNIVPDRARAWGNLRFLNEDAERVLLDGVRGLAGATAPVRDGLPSVSVNVAVTRPRKPATPEVRGLAALAQLCANDLGQQLPLGTTGGVCDGNNMQAAGLPVLDTLGVLGGSLHTTDEWIDLRSLVSRAQLAAVLLVRLHEIGKTR